MKIRLCVETGFAGCDHVDFQDLPDDWNDMSEEDREKFLDEVATNFLANCINYSACVVDDDVED